MLIVENTKQKTFTFLQLSNIELASLMENSNKVTPD